ncbi:hypothetical protein K4K51_013015 [Colletotrichum sp. SAR 10_75]|nr:hypothetical protein K4K51_013015 [Colletotrichum sp. SAR 10_75]
MLHLKLEKRPAVKRARVSRKAILKGPDAEKAAIKRPLPDDDSDREPSGSSDKIIDVEAEATTKHYFDIECDKAWTFLVETPDTSPGAGQVFLIAENKKFSVRETILIKHSDYFERCLKNPNFVESQTKTFTFDDVPAIHLGIYLYIAYCQALGQSSQVPYLGEPESCIWFPGHVEIYRLCDRFANGELATQIYRDLNCRFLYSRLRMIVSPIAGDWSDDDDSNGAADLFNGDELHRLRFYIESLAQCFKLLDSNFECGRTLRHDVIYAFCRTFPRDWFRYCFKRIKSHHEFAFEVALRYIDVVEEERLKILPVD